MCNEKFAHLGRTFPILLSGTMSVTLQNFFKENILYEEWAVWSAFQQFAKACCMNTREQTCTADSPQQFQCTVRIQNKGQLDGNFGFCKDQTCILYITKWRVASMKGRRRCHRFFLKVSYTWCSKMILKQTVLGSTHRLGSFLQQQI